MAPFRLAHLSDPHLPWTTPHGIEWLGKRGLTGLNWIRRRAREHRAEVAQALATDLIDMAPDAVAITGDVVNFALPREFDASRAWLERFGGPERVLVVPGNHDALAGDWQREMMRAWGPYAPTLPRLTNHGPVGIVQLSSACVTPPLIASGRLDNPDRASAMIAKARSAGLIPVVLIHHPPTRLTSRRKGLVDLRSVQRTLGDAALVLHGHTHRADLSHFPGNAGNVPVIGIPSFSMAPGLHHPAGAWRLLEFSGPQVTITERAVGDDGNVMARTPMRLTLPCRATGNTPE